LLENLNFAAFALIYTSDKSEQGIFMSHTPQNRSKINDFCARTGKYTPDAYEFITGSVIQTVNALEQPRHLTAVEVLDAVSSHFCENYGILAPLIAETWGIKHPSDIGEIIFDLIGMQILSASSDDKRSDFNISKSLFPESKKHSLNVELEIPKID